MIQIKCNDLKLGYDGKIVASNINFEVNKGDYICIVGENGSGKSTLVKSLLNIVKPVSGEIEFVSGFDRHNFGYLPQQSGAIKYFPVSVREVVLSGFSGKKSFSSHNKKNKEICNINMKRLGIYDIQAKSINELSGGQQQRVFLARALCAARDALLLDEPVTGLDPVVASEMYETLKQLNNELQTTVIMVSHDMDSALKYATHILHICHESSFFGTVSEYLNSEIGKTFTKGEF